MANDAEYRENSQAVQAHLGIITELLFRYSSQSTGKVTRSFDRSPQATHFFYHSHTSGHIPSPIPAIL